MDGGPAWPLATDIVIYNEVLVGRASLDRLPVGVVLWQPDGTALFANRYVRESLALVEEALPERAAFWRMMGLASSPQAPDGQVTYSCVGQDERTFSFVLDSVRNLEGRIVADAAYLVREGPSRHAALGGDDSGRATQETLGFMAVRNGCLVAWTGLSRRWPDLAAWATLPVEAALDHLAQEAALGRIPRFSARHHTLSDGSGLVHVLSNERPVAPAASLGTDRLIAATAHEIRNPLATIRGFLQILPRAERADQERYAEIAVHEVDRIGHVVNEFLQAPGDAADAADAEPAVDLAAVASDAIVALKAESQDKAVTVQIRVDGAPVWVEGHPTRLHQVATNLIRNALDAVPEGTGEVLVEVHGEGAWARLAVEDNGPGIPEEWMGDVFDPTFTRHEGGHGLGLAITRWIVTMYRGHVGVGRSASGGARFEVHLPSMAFHPVADDGPPAVPAPVV